MTLEGPSRDQRASLSAAIAAVAAGGELDATAQSVLETAVTTLGASMGVLFLADPDRAGLTLVASVGLADRAAVERAGQDLTDPFVNTVTDRIVTWDREVGAGEVRHSTSYLPLIVGSGGVETVLGCLGVAWPAGSVTDTDTRAYLTDVAGLLAVAADRARLASTAAERSEWFERMAHTDPLTGLANERTVARILELELARAARQGSELSLAIFDIDDFRATNADQGHDAGDDMLRGVAAVLAETVRLVDTVGRIGGDEFVLVAPGSAGGLVARRVLDGIAALPAVGGRTVSVSAGVALFPTDGSDSEALIAAATSALERAKGDGAGTVAESDARTEAVREG